MKYKIRDTQTGQIMEVDSTELGKYGLSEPTQVPVSTVPQPTVPVQQPVQQPIQQQTQQEKQGLISKILSVLAPRTQAIGQDIQASGQTEQYVNEMEQNTQQLVQNALAMRQARQSGNQKQGQLLAQQGRQISGQAEPQQPAFSSDIDKSYLKRGAQTGLELGSYLTPAGKSLKGAVRLGAVSGGMKALSDDKDLKGVATTAATSGLTSGAVYGLLDLGSKLFKAGSENLTLKALRPSKSQITKFNKKTGQDLTSFVQKEKLFQKGTEQVDDKLAELYKQYDDAAIKSGKNVSVKSLLSSFDDKIAELKKYSGSEVNKLVKQLTSEKKILSKSLNGQKEIGLDWITQNRKVLDKVIPESSFMTDPITAGSKKITRDIYKKVIDESTGVTKEIGKKIRNLEAFKDIAEIQQNLGKGNLPAGLLSLLSATAGGGIGYGTGGKDDAIKGALVGYGLTSVVNNPKVITALIDVLGKGSDVLTKASQSAITQVPARVAGQQIGNMLTPSQATNQTPTGLALEQYNVGQHQPQQNQISSQLVTNNYITGRSPEEHYKAYMNAVNAGDKNAAAQIRKLYEDETAYQSSGGKKTEAQIARDSVRELAQSAYNDLLNKDIKTGMMGGPAEQTKSIFGIGEEDTLTFQNKISQIKAMMAKARAGTSFTPNEEKLLNQYTPKISDSYQQLEIKLRGLIESGILESTMKEPTGLQQ